MLAAALALSLASRAAAASLWTTRLDGSERLARREVAAAEADCAAGPAGPSVRLDTAALEQPIDGFGAAMTESSAIVLDSLGWWRRRRALRELFGAGGLRLSTLRVPIGASDFARADYSCDDPPSGADPGLTAFSLERCAGPMLPYLRKAKRLNPALELIGSPWSAPAWMKSNGSMRNGSLKPEYYDAYARYLARFAAEMKKAGAPLTYLTMQNEPGYGTDGYPSMTMTAAEQTRFLAGFLGPTLEANGLSDLKVLVYDHNWSSAAYATAVLSDPGASRYAAGSAFHCYEGSPDMMAPVYAAFPDKELHFTECAAGGWEPRFAPSLAFAMRDLIIGDLANGARSVTMWNLALDEHWGPTNHGCLDCRGVITVLRSSGTYERSPEYYALAHGSLAADPGARRAASRTEDAPAGFREVALAEPDGSLALIVLNEGPSPVRVRARAGGTCVSYDQPAASAATLRWRPWR